MTAASGCRALVVDDDTVSRLVLAHMLRRKGFTVAEADDVEPAAALARSTRFDVVFSDFSMPGGTGLDLLQRLEADGVRAQFVLVTGLVEVADVDHSALTVDAELTKPIDSRTLDGCLQALTDGRAAG